MIVPTATEITSISPALQVRDIFFGDYFVPAASKSKCSSSTSNSATGQYRRFPVVHFEQFVKNRHFCSRKRSCPLRNTRPDETFPCCARPFSSWCTRWLLISKTVPAESAGIADHVMENSKWRIPLKWADR
jgi:hypothetical protein